MTEYISKSDLLAEIEKLSAYLDCLHEQRIIEKILSIIDTLEVKEVDLETAVHGRIDYPLIGHDFPNIYPNYKELKYYCDKNGIKDEDRVKIIITKDDIL